MREPVLMQQQQQVSYVVVPTAAASPRSALRSLLHCCQEEAIVGSALPTRASSCSLTCCSPVVSGLLTPMHSQPAATLQESLQIRFRCLPAPARTRGTCSAASSEFAALQAGLTTHRVPGWASTRVRERRRHRLLCLVAKIAHEELCWTLGAA